MIRLPIDEVIPEIERAVRERGGAVVVAPPGAGKTTRVPPAILKTGGRGTVLMLQPRRVAARAAARRIAQELGSPLGGVVGYQIRFENCSGPETRILVVTEGILTRRLQEDASLPGIQAVIFDEFHERSLHSDLALALVQEVRTTLRPDLEVVVMSATLDPLTVARFLGDVPVVSSKGQSYPVQVHYLDSPDDRPIEIQVAHATRRALKETSGDLLVFLPGAGEIARASEALQGLTREAGIDILPLHGDLPSEAQDRALEKGERRRVVLSTNVAETSLTLEGISAVIDTGLVKSLRHDPLIGIDRLELRTVSLASADQRAGRAGRTGPGQAYRLWTRVKQRDLEETEVPEIRRVDLAALALELAIWGIRDLKTFQWFESPDEKDLERARAVLRCLGAVDSQGLATETGRRMARLPVHPRLARLLLEATARGVPREGAILAALCSERDILSSARTRGRPAREASEVGPSDLLYRFDRYREAEQARFAHSEMSRLGVEAAAVRAVQRTSDQLLRLQRRESNPARESAPSEDELLKILIAGFPDRLARRRAKGQRTAVLVGGSGVELAKESVVQDAPFFLAIALQSGNRPGDHNAGLVRLASEVTLDALEEVFPGCLTRVRELRFDLETEKVLGVDELRYRDLVLQSNPGANVDPFEASAVLAVAVVKHSDRLLPFSEEVESFLLRVRCLKEWMPELELPSLTSEDLLSMLVDLTAGLRSFDEVRRAPLLKILRARLGARLAAIVEKEAPTNLALPSGRTATLRYEADRPPVLSARVQHLFGVVTTPTVAAGRVRCLVELLAPNQRPVQLTQDLQSFWTKTYAQVRKDLRGRYPKHDWPEVPPGF